jgi:hypothetical protein
VEVSDKESILKIDEAAGELEKILKSEKHKASLFASSRW